MGSAYDLPYFVCSLFTVLCCAVVPELPSLQDPRVLAKAWQGSLRSRVFNFFAKQKVLGRLR